MKYALLIYADESGWDAMSDQEKGDLLAKYEVFAQGALTAIRGGEQLHTTAAATTVRVRDEETMVMDGPFAETKEQLGGFFLVECNDVDEAIELAAMIPGARTGAVEVRPVVERPDQPGEHH